MECTVVTPAYNAAHFIEEAMQSVADQDGGLVAKYLVIDDGSQDNTLALAQAMAKGMPHTQVLTHANAGVSATRNRGLEMTESEYVVFLDADDVLLPGAIAAQIRVMRDNPDAVMVYGANYVIDTEGEQLGENRVRPMKTRDFATVAMSVTPCPSQVMLRSAALKKVGGYDPSLKGAEDVDLWLRVIGEGALVAHDQFVMKYRKHPAQMTRNPTRLLADHSRVLRTRLQEPYAPADDATIKAIWHKWQRHYGQYIPMEVARFLVRGKFAEAGASLNLFAKAMPASAIGAASFAKRKLLG